jgi:uncharacterized membrane protein (DUF2068 family)
MLPTSLLMFNAPAVRHFPWPTLSPSLNLVVHFSVQMHSTTKRRQRKSDFALVAIGIFKFVKSMLLIALGVALIRQRDQDLGVLASKWIDTLWLSRSYFNELVVKLSFVSQETIDQFAIGSFVYSALLLIEGVGLCLRRRWAEYLTVGITTSLLPFEFYKLANGVTGPGIVITFFNLAILLYLVTRLRTERRQRTNN